MKTAIPPPNTPFLDGNMITREWYLYLLNRDEKLGGKDGDTTIPDLASEISTIEFDINSLERDISAIEAVNDTQDTQISALQGLSSNNASDISDLQDDVAALESGKEDVSNKVSSWSLTTTNDHYPGEKLVKDSLDGKQDTLVSATNIKTINGSSVLGAGDLVVSGGSTYSQTLSLVSMRV